MDEKDQYYIQLYVYAGVLIAAAIYLLFKSIYETGLIQYLAKKIIGESSVEKIKQQLYINDETTIYRKKKKNVDIQKEMELTKKVLAEMDKKTVKPFLRLKLTNEKTSISGSKVGGIPYIPSKDAIPFDSEGMPLRMLAQIDCRLLSALPDFPQVGLLQFWIDQFDDSLGLFTEGGSRVVWHETVDDKITEEQVRSWLADFPQPDGNEYWFPVTGEFGLSFIKEEEPMPMSDTHFGPIFVKKYNELTEDDNIEDMYDLSDDTNEMIWDHHNGDGHKIGGYPAFSQEDPRESDSDQTVLLLQIDSEDDESIMWGDGGVCGFFCTPDDLKRRDFSKVLYNWDCY